MQLRGDRHLGYCTNIHPAETWEDTFRQLQTHIPVIKQRVAPDERFGIGLRLSAQAAQQLDATAMQAFRRWLDGADCYVFTINGFPYGDFHGTRVKENVYRPDWTTPERLDYTNRLFDILAELLPADILEGSVSTLPGSFKRFDLTPEAIRALRRNVTNCGRHIADLVDRTGKDLHLGLEPEPLGLFETTPETVDFFDALVDSHGDWLRPFVGVNYDTCHLAVEYEEPAMALDRLSRAGIRLSKLHLSSALKLDPRNDAWQALTPFADETYLHQVIVKQGTELRRIIDLPEALAAAQRGDELGEEWRVHFHIPLSDEPAVPLQSTRDHLEGALDWLARHPAACHHLEMETYTWDVLPADLHRSNVDEQLIAEYQWTLAALSRAN
ncbi:metabolite traffic protein EboE [Cerasicoccus arenae]|uniref:Sugar phosphate isomerase n=1 Tax=Cerasicoccus arenae TaxID=424488 RepID=A0A8J3DBM4_9BACT|nr:metabolite traffic protein EboE [Cerasicoccus arenae]MBK1859873.1 metabolite traffic protein EboE [Cerasicoccus arenae]GHC01379.1 sugar phosphate isomerase [Cerasicoccus arenae]